MEHNFVFFWGGVYSQWHKSPFIIDGIMYNCAEQYMMAQKAVRFNDSSTLLKIMTTSDPKKQKQFGREVQNFDPKKWNEIARDIVYVGNYAKFTQNQELKELILSTGDKEFVEASPYDTVWGIGLAEDYPDILDKSKWKGTNWLGEVLTKVRNDIKNETTKNN